MHNNCRLSQQPVVSETKVASESPRVPSCVCCYIKTIVDVSYFCFRSCLGDSEIPVIHLTCCLNIGIAGFFFCLWLLAKNTLLSVRANITKINGSCPCVSKLTVGFTFMASDQWIVTWNKVTWNMQITPFSIQISLSPPCRDEIPEPYSLLWKGVGVSTSSIGRKLGSEEVAVFF